MLDLKEYIREVPDWPKVGVNFKDITPLLQDGEAFRLVIDNLVDLYKDEKVDLVVGIDARGFILASAVAYKLGVGLAIVRKKGKLPCKTVSQEYALEYASNTIEMHEDSIRPGQKILMVDDVLATGGTMAAACEIAKKLGAEIVGAAFLIILDFLKGGEKLNGINAKGLIHYMG
ncbi:MAG: adenine phosphoribosyltransferase [Patescibacteria group bacterium]